MAGHNRRPAMFRSDKVDIEVFDDMMAQIMNGMVLSKLCAMDEYPNYNILVNWLSQHPDLYAKYARAKQVQADYFAEQIIEISDDDNNVARARNRMDARRWHASKIAPRKYGERVLNEITGGLTQRIKVDLSNMSPEVRQQLRESITKQMGEEPKMIEGSYKVVK